MSKPSLSPIPLICLHSSASTGRQWAPMQAALAARHRQVLTPDLPGYDRTQPWPAGRATSLDAEAAALEPLLPSTAAGGAHLFGHSYGAAVALHLALRHPTRVKSLTLYEPVRFSLLFADAPSLRLAREVVAVAQAVQGAVAEGVLHDAGECFVDYWSGAGAWRGLAARQQQVIAARMPKVAAEFGALFDDGVPPSAYAALTMPVHVLAGTRSPWPVRQVAELLVGHLPNNGLTGLTRLAGLGHMGPVEEPGCVLAALGWQIESANEPALALAA